MPFAADPPRFKSLDGILFDGKPRRRFIDIDDDLMSGGTFKGLDLVSSSSRVSVKGSPPCRSPTFGGRRDIGLSKDRGGDKKEDAQSKRQNGQTILQQGLEFHLWSGFGAGLGLEIGLFLKPRAEKPGKQHRGNFIRLVLKAWAASLKRIRSTVIRFSVPSSCA